MGKLLQYSRKILHGIFLACVAFLVSLSSVQAQTNEVYNDAGITLKVWFNGIWSDANCDETLYPSPLNDDVKYVLDNLQVRASNGTANLDGTLPKQNLLNLFPVNMTFTVKGDKVSRFYSPTHSSFRMLNPWYPFQAASMNVTQQTVVANNVSRYNVPVLGTTINPAWGGPNPFGRDATNANNILIYDRTFSGNKAPDRFQWKVDGIWESDADIDEAEAGLVVCSGAFGLPQVAERWKLDNNINPLLTLMMLNEYGGDFITEFILRVGGCSGLFGFVNFDPNSFFGIITNLLITDYDDSYYTKGTWNENEAFFRATPPGQIGYFATQKLKATPNTRTSTDEGYLLLFSYQWNWATPNYAELDPGIRIQAPLCATEQYTDAHPSSPIHVEAWIDGLFNDNDHEGADEFFFESLLSCTDVSKILQMDELIVNNEEIRVRVEGWDSQQGIGGAGFNTTIGWTQNRPDWQQIGPTVPGAKFVDRLYTTQTGMRSFDFRIEAWESDCNTPAPTTCEKCLLGLWGDCCILGDPLFGTGCWVDGFENVSDYSNHVLSANYKINWRNSPPNTDNYYYVPLRLGTAENRNYIAKIRYRWSIPPPSKPVLPPPYDLILCPGESETLTATAVNATWYQWQYVEVPDPAGPGCPSIPDDEWIDIAGAICPSYTLPTSATATRIYRLKVFNRAGSGSNTPNGDKFAYNYSNCVRVQRLPQTVPMTSNLECGTVDNPTLVRSGSTYEFSPVLPPDSGSLDVPNLIYNWNVNNGATVTPNTGHPVMVKFPNAAGVTVRVNMSTVFTNACPSPAPAQRTVSCYFITEDGGCDTLTGVLYVSPTATASGIGTISNPYSLANAFEYLVNEPRIKHVKLLEGNYNIYDEYGALGLPHQKMSSALIITEGLIVDGGYVVETAPDGSTQWVKKSNAVSNITTTVNERINDSTIHRIGFRAVGVNNWTIQDISINTGNAIDRNVVNYGYGKGLSNYGVLISNSSGYTMQNVHVTTGRGGRGGQGISPSLGLPPDVPGLDLTQRAPDGGPSNPGSLTAWNPAVVTALGLPVNGSGDRLPGDGGLATANGNNAPFATAPYGIGGIYGAGDPALRNGQDGKNGDDASAPVGSPFSYTDLHSMGTYFIPKNRTEIVGGFGLGGGGGAGGSAANSSGGSGGVGGRGGFSGYGGGGAFCIWINNSTGFHNNVTVNAANTLPGFAGLGGEGELGQPGGNGYNGGYRGGNGGKGGKGPDGAVGYAFDQYVNPNNSTVTPAAAIDPRITYVESLSGSGCTNTIFEIRKPGNPANWVSLDGGMDVMDITTLYGSTVAANSSPKYIYYPSSASLNGKLLSTSDGAYNNQIYIGYDRQIPTISVPTSICSGTTIDLLSDPNSLFHSEYEWSIQQGTNSTITGINTPAPVMTFNTEDVYGVNLPANTTGSAITYQIRYKVKDDCCGWSIPIYSYITVQPEIVNHIGPSDTTFLCGGGTVAAFNNLNVPSLNTTPSNPTYQWMVSEDGGPYVAIPAATGLNYTPPAYPNLDSGALQKVYQYVRIVGSSTVTCADTSNVLTVIIQPNFTDNNIADPLPTLCVDGAFPSSIPITTTKVNLGFVAGSTPTGPGTSYYYQWQTGYATAVARLDTVAIYDSGNNFIRWDIQTVYDKTITGWKNISTTAPFESGTSPNTKDLDMGELTGTAYTYGSFAQIFPLPNPEKGEIYIRRIVDITATPTVCRDTSDYVIATVNRGVTPWAACPNTLGSSKAACDLAITNALGKPRTALNTIEKDFVNGSCHIQSVDTVCYGEVANLMIPNSQVGSITGFGDQYVWYLVYGGPYNSTSTTISQLYCRGGSTTCVNPFLNANCGNSKPASLDSTIYLGSFLVQRDSTGKPQGMTYQHVMQRTATFYVNLFDECFSDAAYRSTYYSSTTAPWNTLNPRWQRKTIIVRDPIVKPDALVATPARYCNDPMPDSITLTIQGGFLGNDGHYVIYEGDTTDADIIFMSAKSDSSLATGRTHVVKPAPITNTTYYARVVNGCDTTDAVRLDVIIDDASVDPDELLGPNSVCAGEAFTLTVSGGNLGTGAEWVLYLGNTLPGSRITSNTTGVFNLTAASPASTTNYTYIVRAEYSDPAIQCPPTDTVTQIVSVRTDCVCEVNPGVIEYAPTGTTTIATVECEAADGWTYYAEASNPDVYLFAIEKKPSFVDGNTVDFNAVVHLTVTPNPNSPADVFYNFDASICEANFVMPRYWNVQVLGGATLDGFVRTRFYFPPSELAATQSAADGWRVANQPGCNPLPLITGPSQVFKNTDGSFFNPLVSSGLVIPGSDVLPTTINDFRYIAHLISNLAPHGTTGTQMSRNYVQVAWDGFSGGGIAIRVSPDIVVLPVELLYFTGTYVDKKVYLNWETASELNNDYFLVEKSTDGKNWTSIGSVKGHGTTQDPHQYAMIDPYPFQGENYYRLKQVDFDGTFKYSRIIVIDVLNEYTRTESTFAVQPNPTAGLVVATISSETNQKVQLNIFDASGQLMEVRDVALGKGLNKVKVDLSKFPAATYLLSFKDRSGKEYSAKVIKQ